MKLDPSIIALKDFENIKVFRLKLARHSTANKAPSLNASEQFEKPSRWFVYKMTLSILRVSNLVRNISPNVRFVHNIYIYIYLIDSQIDQARLF